MENRVARILLVDDNTLYRESLGGFFARQDGFEVVGEAGSGAEAVRMCAIAHPDIVLMDIQMPNMDGIEATRLIMSKHPEVAVVMLTVSDDERYLLDAIRAGARGYILKNIHARQLKSRLRSVFEGHSVLSSEITAVCIDVVRRTDSRLIPFELEQKASLLTDQEKKILRHLAEGKSNKEIGRIVFMSESSVKKYLSGIMTKLGFENRVQAAVFAIHAGIADLQDAMP